MNRIPEDESLTNKPFRILSEAVTVVPKDFVAVPTVMLIDADRNTLAMMRSTLEGDGYSIEAYEKGGLALAACQKRLPDLMLIDPHMLDMDGFNVCEKFRKFPDTDHRAVLIVTALEDENAIDMTFSAGANDFIAKPINFEVLRMRISRLLGASFSERYLRYLAFHDTLTGPLNRNTFREGRGIYVAAQGKRLVVLHFFIKKTEKHPARPWRLHV